MKKKLLIDCDSVVYRKGMVYLSGIGRTTQELLLALKKIGEYPFDITILTQTIRGKIPESLQSFRHRNLPLPSGEVSEWLKKHLPLHDIINRHDLLHIPHNFNSVNNPEKVVVTIHDALYFSCQEDFLGHDYARIHYPKLAQQCKAIITCSQSSKSDIVHYMEVPPEKVTVVPWGVNSDVFFPVDKQEAQKTLKHLLGLQRPFFVSVSCDIGRKNTYMLMKAFRIALQKKIEHDFVLVWGNPPEQYLNEFANEIDSKRIRFVSDIDDMILRQLYSASTLSWFPSRYEGFGLPVIESMACGTPVVTCRNSSLIEVGGSAALYIDPDDLDGIADIMVEFDKGYQGFTELVERSLVHAAGFTWERTARAYIDFYLENL
jgi:glycosyltransferase involved in cell wall biosynthesis